MPQLSLLPQSHAHLQGRGHHNAAKKQHFPTEKQLKIGSLSALSTETVCKKTFVQDFEVPSNEAYSCTKKESLADLENPDIVGSTVPVKPILKYENSRELYCSSSITNQLVTQEG